MLNSCYDYLCCSYINVVWTDVDFPTVPVGAVIDCHAGLAPLQLIVQANCQNLREKIKS